MYKKVYLYALLFTAVLFAFASGHSFDSETGVRRSVTHVRSTDEKALSARAPETGNLVQRRADDLKWHLSARNDTATESGKEASDDEGDDLGYEDQSDDDPDPLNDLDPGDEDEDADSEDDDLAAAATSTSSSSAALGVMPSFGLTSSAAAGLFTVVGGTFLGAVFAL